MRLFAAVDPPAEIRSALDAAIGDRDPGLRWVPLEQWHLTLAFYGEVPEPQVSDLTVRLERAASRVTPFTLRLAGAGTFPANAARARHVWVGIDGDREPLGRLAASCAAAGRRLGLPVENRSFRPHLTLARARRGDADVRDLVARLSAYASAEWTVREAGLVHSTIGRTVTHRLAARLRFGGK